VTASNYLPKKYKAHFVLTIYSKYFQSPLIGDFVPGLGESTEMRSQRESLIRQILTPEYLDMLGTKYGIYGADKKNPLAFSWISLVNSWSEALGLSDPTSKDSKLSMERESLRARIEINATNSTTFNVGFVYSDPVVTLKVTQDIYAQVIQSLLDVRARTLDNVRGAIQNRLAALPVPTAPVAAAPAPALPPSDEQNVQNELTEVRNQLRYLTSQYTDEHPLVMQMRDRERILVSRLGNFSSASSGGGSHRDGVRAAAGSGETGRDMYSDLSKKLSYINIAIDSDRRHQGDYFAMLETPLYPAAPLGPKKALIVLWGIALGLFGSLFVSVIREYFERSTLHASSLAHQLDVPLLGELPPFPSKIS
jgi:hypothetical protein